MKSSIFLGGAALLLLAGCQGGMSMGIPGWSQQKVPVSNTTMNENSGGTSGATMPNNAATTPCNAGSGTGTGNTSGSNGSAGGSNGSGSGGAGGSGGGSQ